MTKFKLTTTFSFAHLKEMYTLNNRIKSIKIIYAARSR